jgi:ketosteroid isomerase-like protein
MPQSASPREVFAQLLDGVTSRALADLHTLYAEDAVVEHPFATSAARRLEGREAIRQHFAAGASIPLEMRASNIVIHDTADPELIVAEFDYHGRVTSTSRTFAVPNIFVIRVRDGKIVSSRDYVNHLALAAALDRLPQLVEAISKQQTT